MNQRRVGENGGRIEGRSKSLEQRNGWLLTAIDPRSPEREGTGNVLYWRLPADRLWIQLHQTQHILRHVGSHWKTELACSLVSDGVIMRPCAAGSAVWQSPSISPQDFCTQQLADLVAHLRNCFLTLIGQYQCFVVHFGDRFLMRWFQNRSRRILADLWSTGPKAACSHITISSAASAISVPLHIA